MEMFYNLLFIYLLIIYQDNKMEKAEQKSKTQMADLYKIFNVLLIIIHISGIHKKKFTAWKIF